MPMSFGRRSSRISAPRAYGPTSCGMGETEHDDVVKRIKAAYDDQHLGEMRRYGKYPDAVVSNGTTGASKKRTGFDRQLHDGELRIETIRDKFVPLLLELQGPWKLLEAGCCRGHFCATCALLLPGLEHALGVDNGPERIQAGLDALRNLPADVQRRVVLVADDVCTMPAEWLAAKAVWWANFAFDNKSRHDFSKRLYDVDTLELLFTQVKLLDLPFNFTLLHELSCDVSWTTEKVTAYGYKVSRRSVDRGLAPHGAEARVLELTGNGMMLHPLCNADNTRCAHPNRRHASPCGHKTQFVALHKCGRYVNFEPGFLHHGVRPTLESTEGYTAQFFFKPGEHECFGRSSRRRKPMVLYGNPVLERKPLAFEIGDIDSASCADAAVECSELWDTQLKPFSSPPNMRFRGHQVDSAATRIMSRPEALALPRLAVVLRLMEQQFSANMANAETDSVWLLKKTPSSGGFEDLHADFKGKHGFIGTGVVTLGRVDRHGRQPTAASPGEQLADPLESGGVCHVGNQGRPWQPFSFVPRLYEQDTVQDADAAMVVPDGPAAPDIVAAPTSSGGFEDLHADFKGKHGFIGTGVVMLGSVTTPVTRSGLLTRSM